MPQATNLGSFNFAQMPQIYADFVTYSSAFICDICVKKYSLTYSTIFVQFSYIASKARCLKSVWLHAIQTSNQPSVF